MSTLQQEGFPGCCAGLVLFSFDSEYDNQHHDDEREPQSKESLKGQIEYVMTKRKESYNFMMATTNSNQIVPAEILSELGFAAIEKLNSKHEGIVITIWCKKFNQEATIP